tara:strand:- start:754 stop:951 length:198 start_codon:yes stop_codon:yes gene_type:complete
MNGGIFALSPALIVTSPYTQTRQTAAPTIARFPEVSVEIWPIEEFTYLKPACWSGKHGTGTDASL